MSYLNSDKPLVMVTGAAGFVGSSLVDFLLTKGITARRCVRNIAGYPAVSESIFENGDIGYSPGKGKYDGLQLKVNKWKVALLNVESVQSSFFENETVFPKGSVKFDNALLMTDIEHEWVSLNSLQP